MSDGSEFSWVSKAKDAFLNYGYDYNVINRLEGWCSCRTFDLDYPKAAQNTRVVGDVMGSIMNWLTAQV